MFGSVSWVEQYPSIDFRIPSLRIECTGMKQSVDYIVIASPQLKIWPQCGDDR
jgi:hypothetical protein